MRDYFEDDRLTLRTFEGVITGALLGVIIYASFVLGWLFL